MLEVVADVVVEDLVAERVDLPGEGLRDVEVKISKSKLGDANSVKEG